jgi:hypothetical protein
METTQHASGETEQATNHALELADQANGLVVINQETYEQGAELLVLFKDMEKEIKTVFDPIVSAAHKAHKAATGQRNKALAPLNQATTAVKTTMKGWAREQEKKRQDEERAERERLRKEAEDRQLEAAEKAAANGEQEKAEAILEKEAYVPQVAHQKATPKADGVQNRTKMVVDLVDVSQVDPSLLVVNMVKARQIARDAFKAGGLDAANKAMPGFKVWEDVDVAVTG